MENWTYNAERTQGGVAGRVRVGLLKKLNLLWWFMNDTEQTVDQATWYHPEWSHWRRWVVWNIFRNPMQNFRCFVAGVQDKNYNISGRAPVDAVQRDDLGQLGWQRCTLKGGDLWFPRAFVSYSGVHVTWYAGWQPSGFFGFKLVLR